jgi:hypothetical protein
MKIYRTMLSLIMLILIMCGLPAYATTWENETGPYPTTVVNDTGPDGTFYIYRPQTLRSNTHPLAVFCVGTGSHPRNAAGLLANLALHGVVVIASTNPYQSDGSQASAGVNWLIGQNGINKSEYYQKLIPSRVLAIGHSAGGGGAVWASIKNSNITCLLLYAPVLDTAKSSDIAVPTFFISGALDKTVPPPLVKASYQEVTKSNAWYGENTNQSHIGFGSNKSIQYYTRAYLYTHLFNDSGTARGCFYGPNWTFKNASDWNEKLKNNDAF